MPLLVATDLSDRSDRAVERAFNLARRLDTPLTLLTVVDESYASDFMQEIGAKAHHRLEAIAGKFGTGVTYDIRVETGDPLALLIEEVNSPDLDLVVMGRHRQRGILDGLRATTVESVVSRSLTPVLMVVDPVLSDYRRVLAPVAFSATCARAVETAKTIAGDATCRIFHVWSAPFEGLTGGKGSDYARAVEAETRDQAADWVQSFDAPHPDVPLIHGPLGAAVQQEILSFGPDLLAIGATTRPLSFSGLGSFAADMVRDPPNDLLIVRAAKP